MKKSLYEISLAVNTERSVSVDWSELREHFPESEDAVSLGGVITWARANGFEYSLSDLDVDQGSPWRGSVTIFRKGRR